MANKRVLALRKQLKREQLHVKWLKQHLPNSCQFYSARTRIAQLIVLEDAVGSAALPLRDATTTRCRNKKERRRSAALSLTKVGFA